ncbi:methionyl-tRNA formyltransferase [Timonella sp. A28]|uniref:methionyl-tRNA formyltransferase n=1 Tax=Timonella sp. A28 TaxID=3442640 RepID=UPI003EBF0D14
MRLLFAGTPAVAVPALRALVESEHEVVAVLTRADARKGRGRQLFPSDVKQAALEFGIPVITDRPRSEGFVEQLEALDVECAAVVAYGEILPVDVLDVPTHGWINLHFSVLPAWRGAAPVQRAIMAGDEVTGASTFRIEQGLDTGPVYGMMTETIRRTDTSGDLLGRLSESGAHLLVGTMDALAQGAINPVPQGVEGISLAPKLTSVDACVQWRHPKHIVDRVIRGCTPEPGAWTTLPGGTRLGVGPLSNVARGVEVPEDLTPGELRFTKKNVFVGTGSGTVTLGNVTPVGKKTMNAADWVRGARLEQGIILGTENEGK